MAKKSLAYKKTEKWWLGLTVLFYALYNLPGVPSYGDARGALIHGALTVIPLWVLAYVGMVTVNKQRVLKDNVVVDTTANEIADSKGGEK